MINHTNTMSEATTTELVLAVTSAEATAVMSGGQSDHHQPRDRFQPISENCLAYLEGLAKFLPRPESEKDITHKQLIVYVVIKHDGKTLCYTRGKVGAEARLHAKRSIGAGGHINPEDWDSGASTPIRAAVSREMSEELGIEVIQADLEFVGLVSEDETEVGQVHLGLVFELELDSLEGINFEDCMLEPTWMSDDQLSHVDNLEPWSALVFAASRLPADTPTVDAWITRLVAKRDQNAERVRKLRGFVHSGSVFHHLPREDRQLMRAQLGAMEALGSILDMRLNRAQSTSEIRDADGTVMCRATYGVRRDVPMQIPPDTTIVAKSLPDGTKAVKVSARDQDGAYLYAVYTDSGRCTGELLDLGQVRDRAGLDQ